MPKNDKAVLMPTNYINNGAIGGNNNSFNINGSFNNNNNNHKNNNDDNNGVVIMQSHSNMTSINQNDFNTIHHQPHY